MKEEYNYGIISELPDTVYFIPFVECFGTMGCFTKTENSLFLHVKYDL
jgi:hypothetical protein